MQSDKHLNNMQELNNSQGIAQPPEIRESPKGVMGSMSSSGAGQVTQQQQQQPPSAPPSAPTTPLQQQQSKPKPNFRCDVCSYETSVARNLRIHMTSEKHTHNMAVLQNNIKHLQALTFLQTQNLGHLGGLGSLGGAGSPNVSQIVPSLAQSAQSGLPSNAGHLPEAALADLAYNQALMFQLLHQNSGGLNNANGGSVLSMAQQQAQNSQSNQILQQAQQQQPNGTTSVQDIDQGLNPETLEPPVEQDFNPHALFSCLICAEFNTNSLDELNNHIMMDRSRNNCTQDITTIINNNYICRLCNYKTNLKANFQLHSKTDKHLQKLNFINHIKEGGLRNEYKLKYITTSSTNNNNYNIIQLKCNCCDYYTNSIQKLNLHIQNVRHDNMKIIFNHLIQLCKDFKNSQIDGTETNVNKALFCQLCNYKSNNILGIVKHIKSLRHIQIEQIYCLQRRCENLENLELGDIIQLIDGKFMNF